MAYISILVSVMAAMHKFVNFIETKRFSIQIKKTYKKKRID